MRNRFQFRLIPFIAAALAVALGVSLGQWQLRRADQKHAIEITMSVRETAPEVPLNAEPLSPEQAENFEFRRVMLHGIYKPEWQIFLDNRPHKGVAGFVVLMPLKLAGSDMHVLVARGWLPRDPANRARIAPFETPRGLVQVQGMVKRNAGHVMQLGSAQPLHPAAIVQNLDPADFARASKLNVHPFIVEQVSDAKDGLVRDWPRPSSGVDKHLGYAFQWFALAATALIFFLVTGFRGSRREHAAD
jgi:surfeit locus 1 family protein